MISDESRLLSSGNNNNNNNRDVSSVGGGGGRLNPTSPAEFDRYPSMAGSRVVSSTSLVSFNNPSNMMRNHHQHQPHLGSSSSPTSSSMNNDSISDKSSPFLMISVHLVDTC